MTIHSTTWIKAGALSCLLACAGDLVVPVLLARSYPGYDPMARSESILGAAGSPVAGWFTAWSVCLAVLFFVFAHGLHHAFWPAVKGMGVASWLLILYGIGEGLGSGLFPFDHSGGVLTLSGKIHSMLSILGSAALFLLPVAWLWRPPATGPRLKGLSWAVILLGGLFMLLFGAAKLGWFGQYGLWQRAYLVVYYVYLLVLAGAMFRVKGTEVKQMV